MPLLTKEEALLKLQEVRQHVENSHFHYPEGVDGRHYLALRHSIAPKLKLLLLTLYRRLTDSAQ